MRGIGLLLAIGATSVLLAACPDPEALGHKPSEQVHKAQQAVDKAEQSMQQRVNKAVKTGDGAGTQE